jgi:hypothetical protein
MGYLASRPMENRPGAAAANTPYRTYTTNFSLVEFPLSEGGNWIGGHSIGLDWSDLGAVSGHTYGKVLAPGYDDPTALLSGAWGPDQMASGIVFSANQEDSPNQEVELRLRSSLSPHNCTGYEIGWRISPNQVAYMGIARWNGRLGDFTPLVTYYGAETGVRNGDLIEAVARGDVISAYKNGVLQARVKDNTFPTGSPGMGTYWGPGTNTNFGLSQFMATDQLPKELTPNLKQLLQKIDQAKSAFGRMR